MMDKVGVQWVVAGDQDCQGGRSVAPGTTGLLPQRRTGSRPACHQNRVQPADINAQLKGISCCQTAQLPRAKASLQLSPLLRQISAPVGRNARSQRRVYLAQ